jgi:hypothetical protein
MNNNKKKKVGLVGDIFNLKKTKVFFCFSAAATQPARYSFSLFFSSSCLFLIFIYFIFDS